MPRVVQDFVRKPGVVGKPVGGQCDRIGPGGPRQTFARQRIPYRLVEETRRIPAADHGIAEMEMIGMSLWKSTDGDLARSGPLIGRFGKTRERLEKGQGAQLQRIELQRV